MCKKSVFLSVILVLMILLCAAVGALAEDPPTPTPTAPPEPPPQGRLNRLAFQIEGPDPRMPMTVTYGDFTSGALRLENLIPGTYTITEVSPERLLNNYTLNRRSSETTVTLEVASGEDIEATLRNVYETVPPGTPTPAPTPTPALTSVTVNKVWTDNDNADGNRPERLTVFLYANGQPMDTASLSGAAGWRHTFTDLPSTDENGNTIRYTVQEPPVPMYTSSVSGTTITNTYHRETTQATVRKIWADEENQAGLRPSSVRCRLSNGMSVVLNERNNWTATIMGLPKVLNGQLVEYTWRENEILGYQQTGQTKSGTVTTFTNAPRKPKEAPEGKKTGVKRGAAYLLINDYGTALGMEVSINQAGDSFD